MFRRKFRSQVGITLIEMMSTLVILGIVSSMAVPRFQKAYERMKFRTAGRDLQSTLRVARSTAISDKTPYGIFVNPDLRTVTVFKDSLNQSNYAYDEGDPIFRVDTLPSEFEWLYMDADNSTMIFQPNGSAKFTGGGYIYAMAQTEDVVSLLSYSVLASTGRIKFEGHYY